MAIFEGPDATRNIIIIVAVVVVVAVLAVASSSKQECRGSRGSGQ